jgi:hypothetical protein
MPGLEYVVRPFQKQQVALPATIEDEAADAPNVVVALASKGNAVTFAYSFASSAGVGNKFTEVERTSRRVRVENPDDPSQFVEVQRAKKITVANEDNPDDKLVWTFKEPTP